MIGRDIKVPLHKNDCHLCRDVSFVKDHTASLVNGSNTGRVELETSCMYPLMLYFYGYHMVSRMSPWAGEGKKEGRDPIPQGLNNAKKKKKKKTEISI